MAKWALHVEQNVGPWDTTCNAGTAQDAARKVVGKLYPYQPVTLAWDDPVLTVTLTGTSRVICRVTVQPL